LPGKALGGGVGLRSFVHFVWNRDGEARKASFPASSVGVWKMAGLHIWEQRV
jgi:hypothetical protein